MRIIHNLLLVNMWIMWLWYNTIMCVRLFCEHNLTVILLPPHNNFYRLMMHQSYVRRSFVYKLCELIVNSSSRNSSSMKGHFFNFMGERIQHCSLCKTNVFIYIEIRTLVSPKARDHTAGVSGRFKPDSTLTTIRGGIWAESLVGPEGFMVIWYCGGCTDHISLKPPKQLTD